MYVSILQKSACVPWCQWWAVNRQWVAEAKEAMGKKLKTEEVIIWKKGVEVEPLEVKPVEAKVD